MEHYAGIDVSLELSSVCVVDAQGKIVRETKVASEPKALVASFASLGFAVKRIGLEARPLSAWLHAGLKRAGFDTVLLETRHVKAALSAMMVKTDRKDARGLAQLIRMGWFGITRTGDEMVRTALYEAANVLLARITRFSKLKRWGMDVAKRRGSKRAKVALARKIAVICIECGLTVQLTDGLTRTRPRCRYDKEKHEMRVG